MSVSAVSGGVAEIGAASSQRGPEDTGGTNVWLVDSQAIFQNSLARGLTQTADLILAGWFTSPAEALEWRCKADRPDVILVDYQTCGADPVKVVRQFRAAFPAAPLLILTDSIQEEALSDSICAGATGCLLKSIRVEKITESIREARRGGAPLTPAFARLLLQTIRRLAQTPRQYPLTSRERAVLELLARGLPTKQIAEDLAVSYHTIDSHVRSIYEKLNVHSRAGAVAKALRERLI